MIARFRKCVGISRDAKTVHLSARRGCAGFRHYFDTCSTFSRHESVAKPADVVTHLTLFDTIDDQQIGPMSSQGPHRRLGGESTGARGLRSSSVGRLSCFATRQKGRDPLSVASLSMLSWMHPTRRKVERGGLRFSVGGGPAPGYASTPSVTRCGDPLRSNDGRPLSDIRPVWTTLGS